MTLLSDLAVAQADRDKAWAAYLRSAEKAHFTAVMGSAIPMLSCDTRRTWRTSTMRKAGVAGLPDSVRETKRAKRDDSDSDSPEVAEQSEQEDQARFSEPAAAGQIQHEFNFC